MSARAAVKKVRDAMGEAVGAFLGVLVWWELSDARVSRSALEALWKANGIDTDYLPEVPTTARALRHAVEEQPLKGTGVLVRLSLQSPTEVCYAVVEENLLGTGTNRYRQLDTIRLERKTGAIKCDHHHAVADAVITSYHSLRDSHSSDEVRTAIVRAVREGCYGAPLRKHGGFYWVSPMYNSEQEAVGRVVESLGQSVWYTLPIHESVQTVKAVSAGAQDSLRSELADLHAQIEGYKTNPAKRATTYETRLEDLAALRDRASLYHTVLSVEVSDLEAEVQTLEATLQDMIDNPATDEEA